MSARGDAILELIRSDPLGWRFGRHTAAHGKIDMGIWTDGGFGGVEIYPGPSLLSLWDKWRIYRALANARVKQAVEKAAAVSEGRRGA